MSTRPCVRLSKKSVSRVSEIADGNRTTHQSIARDLCSLGIPLGDIKIGDFIDIATNCQGPFEDKPETRNCNHEFISTHCPPLVIDGEMCIKCNVTRGPESE